VVGLIRAGSGPACRGRAGADLCECASLQDPIRKVFFLIYPYMCMDMLEGALVHTHTHTHACLANELPTSAPAMLMKAFASLRGKYDRSSPLLSSEVS